MKNVFKLFVVACSSLLMLTGCEKDDDFTPEITVEDLTVETIPSYGGTRLLTFASNVPWKIEGADAVDWCTVSPSSGEPAATIVVTISARPNTLLDDRTVTLTLKGEGLEQTFPVTVVQRKKIIMDTAQSLYEDVPCEGQTINIGLETNLSAAEYTVEVPEEYASWLSVARAKALSSDTVVVTVGASTQKEPRTGTVAVKWSDEDGLKHSREVTFVQNGIDNTLQDGKVITVQQGSLGHADLVFMGDGFIAEEMDADEGRYIKAMYDAIDFFFDVEPYKTYRDYFNVYIVGAISPEQGASDLTTRKRTRFSVKFEGQQGETSMTCDNNTVFSYATKAPIDDLAKTLIILISNSPRYGGTTISWSPGQSIAICPMIEGEPPYDYKSVVQHEAGGHGFGKLCDEYIYYQQEIPSNVVSYLKQWASFGHNANIDFTNDPDKIKWRHFYSLPGYSSIVNAFEGSYMYAKGIWRPETNSCMNNNVPYYNSPSRQKIVERIMELSGKPFDFDEFLANDAKVLATASAVKAPAFAPLKEMPHFAPPVLIEGSPVETK